MPEFDEAQIERVIAACRENAGALAESLGLCFERSYRIEVGDSYLWGAPELDAMLAGPGLVVALDLGQAGMICSIPAALPLPEWYTNPGDSEQSRLQTLAMEWSLNLVPSDFEVLRFATTAIADLKSDIAAARPAGLAAALKLDVYEAGSDASAGSLCLVWPVEAAPVPGTKPAAQAPSSSPRPAASQPTSKAAPAAQPSPAPAPARPSPSRRLVNLPVTVVVRLAEKKIEVGQLLALSPGALITFNKSCEDLLDLYVNNHLYCRGEAVKIGEKFGLKVNEVGATKQRERRVLNS